MDPQQVSDRDWSEVEQEPLPSASDLINRRRVPAYRVYFDKLQMFVTKTTTSTTSPKINTWFDPDTSDLVDNSSEDD